MIQQSKPRATPRSFLVRSFELEEVVEADSHPEAAVLAIWDVLQRDTPPRLGAFVTVYELTGDEMHARTGPLLSFLWLNAEDRK